MRWWYELKYIMRKLNRRRAEQEAEEEIQTHLGLETREKIEAGLSPEESRYAARRAFGSVALAKEDSRAVWGFGTLETLWQDLRYGLRLLMKNTGFTLVAIFTLALGIGATTAIFSVVDSVLLKPLPYTHPEELVALRLTAQRLGTKDIPVVSASAYIIFREQSRTFQDIGLYSFGVKGAGYSVNITGPGEPERVPALAVTDGLLPILGVTPLLGRSFTRADDSPDSAETVILTYGYWSRKFGGDPSVIGRTIEVDGRPRAIIGVLPESFRFLDQTYLAMLLPLKLNREKTYLGAFVYGGIARLKPGVTLAQANADVAHMLPIVNRAFFPPPGFSLKWFEDMMLGPNLRSLKQEVVGDVSNVLWVLMGGISLVLVIACANLANLLLVRAEGRRQELAIRTALGASRGRIAAQLFFESLILAVFGGLFGLGLAYWALRVLVAMAPQDLPRLHEIGVDGNTVLFTLAVSVGASLLFGSVPVFKYAGAGLGIGLHAGGRSMSESRERHRSRGILVIVQVALALVLLVSSGLMIRTFRALTSVNPGFVAPSEVQIFSIAIRDTQVKDPERVVRIEEEILHKIEAIPGVSSVGLSRTVPMDGSGWFDAVFAKDRALAPNEHPSCRFEFVAPGFFKTLGTPLVAGRDFTWSEIYNKVPVAIVSEKFAREYWRNPASALGKQIRANQKGDWREVVGVVRDIHQDGVDKVAPTSVSWPILVANFGGNPDVFAIRNVTFAIRSPRAGSEGLMNEIRRAVWSVAPYLPLAEVHTLNDYYTRSMARTSFTLVMLAVAGSMALLLGIVGLYGVIAYSVSQRRREIGIRMALGAGKSEVLKMVTGEGIKLALIGVAIGLAGALGLTRFLSGLLYGVKPGDPLTLIAVSSLLMAVALLASYIPARQAANVDPLAALREE
ncbi:MAG: ABC transporter permease [Acidobacteria bacterium]|nr:ABC transporter permease [Acidobacteriota bacterium]